MDKAGEKYWSQLWEGGRVPDAVNPRRRDLRNFINRRLHEYFRAALIRVPTRGAHFLEIGCASSAWLPYFAREFGMQVSGLDYSAVGCRQAQMVLEKAGVKGDIIHTDAFAPPPHLLQSFDFVWSNGVLEHFEDTAGTLEAFARFLKPGGIIITTIPNIAGLIGQVQKIVNRPVYDLHVPLDAQDLRQAHEKCGLEVTRCDYVVSSNFGVCNLNGVPRTPQWFAKKAVLSLLTAFSVANWFVESQTRPRHGGPNFAPYIFCVARKTTTPNATALDATAPNATALDATAPNATALDATAPNATALDATGPHMSTHAAT